MSDAFRVCDAVVSMDFAFSGASSTTLTFTTTKTRSLAPDPHICAQCGEPQSPVFQVCPICRGGFCAVSDLKKLL